jgi:hypothetical protein
MARRRSRTSTPAQSSEALNVQRLRSLSELVASITRQTLVLSEQDLRELLALAERADNAFVTAHAKAILGFRLHLEKLRGLE